MVRIKTMNEGYFAQLLKDFHAFGELVRARQDEKQAILSQFEEETKRFFFGKISEKALASSVKKTNKELHRLDTDIRKSIVHAKQLADKTRSFVAQQWPQSFKATLSGIATLGAKAKKKAKHKKKAKKRSKKKKK